MSQVPIHPDARADDENDHGIHEVAPDIAYLRLAIVNVAFLGPANASDRQWILVDAGIPASGRAIREAAERRFGAQSRPAAIVLTHGHFDHVGVLKPLADAWEAPIYAHERETPFLDGREKYPPPDPSVGGGLMATLSRFFPRGPFDVHERLQPLNADGSVPFMPDWRWIHTPGHTPGHVSLWRESDRSLIAGDAFITTRQESAFAVALQMPEIHGPPAYYTFDWDSAWASVQRLAALEPELVVTGHGPAMRGLEMREALHTLADNFERIAIPAKHGGRERAR